MRREYGMDGCRNHRRWILWHLVDGALCHCETPGNGHPLREERGPSINGIDIKMCPVREWGRDGFAR